MHNGRPYIELDFNPEPPPGMACVMNCNTAAYELTFPELLPDEEGRIALAKRIFTEAAQATGHTVKNMRYAKNSQTLRIDLE